MNNIENKITKKPKRNRLAEKYEKEIYDLKQMLEISKSLCSVFEFKSLCESILYVCMCQMRVIAAAMFIKKSFDDNCFSLDSNYNGFIMDESISYKIPEDHPIIKYSSAKNEPFTLDEIRADAPDVDIPNQIESLMPSLVVPLKQKSTVCGLLLLGERIDLGDGLDYNEYDRQQIKTIASLSAIAISNSSLIEMSTTDMMTHLKLKHYFYQMLSEKLDFATLNKQPLSVMMLDIDFFKKFNDTYGHACGDFVLQKIARTILESIRSQDLAGRYGGEEFVVMLANNDDIAAKITAERVRHNIEKAVFDYEGQKLNVTISIGVSTYLPEQNTTAKNLVELADKALYVSKRNGRNRVTMADEELIKSLQDED